MLYTNLKHIETAREFERIIRENEYVIVICGRMGVQCVPVYRFAEDLEKEYHHVKVFDMEYDNPESHVIRELAQLHGSANTPFIVYYKHGKIIKATSGMQTQKQVADILNTEFKLQNA